MVAVLEARRYEDDSTPEEVELLRSQVYVYEDENDIIYYKEAVQYSEFQLDIYFEEVEKLVAHRGFFYFLIDLVDTERPSAKIRSYLKYKFKPYVERMHVAAYTGKNVWMNMAAKFVMSGTFDSFSIHKTKEEALAELHGRIRRRRG